MKVRRTSAQRLPQAWHTARFQIGEPDLVRSSVCADRDRMAAIKICATDQETAQAGGAHFSDYHLLRAGSHAIQAPWQRPMQWGRIAAAAMAPRATRSGKDPDSRSSYAMGVPSVFNPLPPKLNFEVS